MGMINDDVSTAIVKFMFPKCGFQMLRQSFICQTVILFELSHFFNFWIFSI